MMRRPWLLAVVAMSSTALVAPLAFAAGERGARPGTVADAAANADVTAVVQWIAQSHDNGRKPFLIVDKRNARLFVFDAHATMVASSTILLGAAPGDYSVPGIGERKMSDILPHERTT